MSATFRFIHFSDPHLAIEPRRFNALALARRKPFLQLDTFKRLGSSRLNQLRNPSTFMPEILHAAARFLLEYSDIVDAVMFTGDLATTGMMADLEVASRYTMPASPGKFRSSQGHVTLCQDGVDFYAIPGNHDRYQDNLGSSSSIHYDIQFSKFSESYHNKVSHSVRSKDGINLAIICGDFCLQSDDDSVDTFVDKAIDQVQRPLKKPLIGRFSRYGQGKVYTSILSEMTERTLSLRSKYADCAVVWAIHFAPFDCGNSLRLIDWEDYVEAAQRLKISLTLCGHTHDQRVMKYTDHLVYCAGSCGCTDSVDDSRMHIVEISISDDIRIRRENYKWNSRDGEFIFESVDE